MVSIVLFPRFFYWFKAVECLKINAFVYIYLQGTPEKLLELLMSPVSSADPTFIEDFLLTYRTFLESPLVVANKLLDWFKNPAYRQQASNLLVFSLLICIGDSVLNTWLVVALCGISYDLCTLSSALVMSSAY